MHPVRAHRALARPAARLFNRRDSLVVRTFATSPRNMSQLADFGTTHIARGLKRLTDTVMESGEGSFVTMEGGKKMLDFTAGIGVVNLGHCHPKVSQAAAKQCMTLVHGQCSIAFNKPYIQLIEKLLPVMPDKSLDTFFLWNSGAEAIEAAVKMARAVTDKQNIIVMQGGYHGRTYGTMALTRSKTVYSVGQHPLMGSVFTMPFPYWHQLGMPQSTPTETLVQMCLYQLSLLLAQQTAGSDTAAILLEPVLGEGGYVPAPPAFLHGLREVCDKNNILLIVDEVQSGFGRTGKYFAVEHSGVRPDVMVFAKGVANGFPLSGIVSRKELMDIQPPGTMGGTYAGNAVACAAGVACAEVMAEENILENVNARSKELFAALEDIKSDPKLGPLIADIRGMGLMVGIEFASPKPLHKSDHASNSIPDAVHSMSSRVAAKCLEKGMLILTTSVYEVIRFIPPLTVSKEEMAEGIRIFREAVEEVAKEG